jgi:hypothetical protein
MKKLCCLIEKKRQVKEKKRQVKEKKMVGEE